MQLTSPDPDVTPSLARQFDDMAYYAAIDTHDPGPRGGAAARVYFGAADATIGRDIEVNLSDRLHAAVAAIIVAVTPR